MEINSVINNIKYYIAKNKTMETWQIHWNNYKLSKILKSNTKIYHFKLKYFPEVKEAMNFYSIEDRTYSSYSSFLGTYQKKLSSAYILYHNRMRYSKKTNSNQYCPNYTGARKIFNDLSSPQQYLSEILKPNIVIILNVLKLLFHFRLKQNLSTLMSKSKINQ